MTNFEQLHSQNHTLIEASNVLMYLLQDRSMCDTGTACDLLYNFMENLNHHMGMVGTLYQGLLNDDDQKTNNAARLFMSGDQELKRIIKQYKSKWCNTKLKQLKIADHERFTQDTVDLFELVLKRIQDETEHLYPLVKGIKQKQPRVEAAVAVA